MAYSIVRLDRVNRPETISVLNTVDNLENGAFVTVKELGANGQREVYKTGALLGAATETVAMVYADVVHHDERKDERDTISMNGDVVRAYLLQRGEMYTIAKKHITGVVAVNDILEPKKSTNTLTKVGEAPVKAIARVVELTNYEGQESVVIEIL